MPKRKKPKNNLRLTRTQRQLYDDHQALVNFVSAEFLERYPWANRDELRQACLVGLARSAKVFDPARGVAFGAFARIMLRKFCNAHLFDKPLYEQNALRFERQADTPVMTSKGETLTLGELAENRLGRVSAQDEQASLREVASLVELREAVEHLTTLTPLERRVLKLRFFRGLEIAETAKKIGWSGVLVKRLARRGVRKLREHFAAKRALPPDAPLPATS